MIFIDLNINTSTMFIFLISTVRKIAICTPPLLALYLQHITNVLKLYLSISFVATPEKNPHVTKNYVFTISHLKLLKKDVPHLPKHASANLNIYVAYGITIKVCISITENQIIFGISCIIYISHILYFLTVHVCVCLF